MTCRYVLKSGLQPYNNYILTDKWNNAATINPYNQIFSERAFYRHFFVQISGSYSKA